MSDSPNLDQLLAELDARAPVAAPDPGPVEIRSAYSLVVAVAAQGAALTFVPGGLRLGIASHEIEFSTEAGAKMGP